MGPVRQVALGAAWLLFVAGTLVALDATTGKTGAAAPLASGALPPDVAGSPSISLSEAAPPTLVSSSVATRPSTTTPVRKPGVPIAIDIPFPSADYPDGVHASITADRLTANGALFVPDDPKTVSWSRQDAAPGSSRGTVILTSHVNFVIDGQTVVGAFADLAEYARTSVGKVFTLRLADGRTLKYRVVAGREYNKDQLAADPGLRTHLYDQTSSFGAPGQPPTSRVLLVSCGGAFDNATGEYEDNVFLYALPVVVKVKAPPTPTPTPTPTLAKTAQQVGARDL